MDKKGATNKPRNEEMNRQQKAAINGGIEPKQNNRGLHWIGELGGYLGRLVKRSLGNTRVRLWTGPDCILVVLGNMTASVWVAVQRSLPRDQGPHGSTVLRTSCMTKCTSYQF